MNYILDGKVAVECDDVLKWAEWYGKANRHIAQTKKKNVRVSTVFLGIDHSFTDGLPLLFETMIFGGKHDQYRRRYTTWSEAAIGHVEACQLAGV